MTKFHFPDHADELLESLKSGRALIGVRDGEKSNLMTIAWGFIGYTWNIPVFIAMVRPSRHTHGFFRKTEFFSVNFLEEKWRPALDFCGSRSGKYFDKFKETGLTPRAGASVETITVEEAERVLECKVVSKGALTPLTLSEKVATDFYSDNSYHSLIFGEIIDSYTLP